MSKIIIHKALTLVALAVLVAYSPVHAAVPEGPVDKSTVGELAYWNAVKDSTNPDDVKSYIDQFPNGMFFDPAAHRYQELTGKRIVSLPADKDQDAVESENSNLIAVPEKPNKAKFSPIVKKSKKKLKARNASKSTRAIQKKTKSIAKGKTRLSVKTRKATKCSTDGIYGKSCAVKVSAVKKKRRPFLDSGSGRGSGGGGGSSSGGGSGGGSSSGGGGWN